MRSGFYPPVSDGGTGERAPLEALWLSNPCVAVGSVGTSQPYVTGPLVEGIYDVWVSDPALVNAGETGISTDPADVSAAAPKIHDGGHWPVAIREGERIALRAMSGSIDFRIFKGC